MRALLLVALLPAAAIAAPAPQEAPCGSCLTVHTTAMGTDMRMTLSDQVALGPALQSPETDIAVYVNPAITHTAIDGAAFEQEVETRGILAVPAVFLNGKPFAQGRGQLTKQFSAEAGEPLCLAPAAGLPHELALEHLSERIWQLGHQEAIYGLELPGLRLEPDSGPSHRDACLRALATSP